VSFEFLFRVSSVEISTNLLKKVWKKGVTIEVSAAPSESSDGLHHSCSIGKK